MEYETQVWAGLGTTFVLVFAAQWLLVGRWRHLYAPPHGAALLGLTWAVALVGLSVGFRFGAGAPLLGMALVVGLPAVALVASFAFRDRRREAVGLPPVRVRVPRHLGAGERILWGAAALAIAAWMIWDVVGAEEQIVFGFLLSRLLFAVWFGHAAWAGRFSRSFRAAFDAEETERAAPPAV